ncbi:GDNF-inducible zinc finger protein 1 isoform X2 [Diabrotica virgifera virgifera]|nr:GDNF-inducible zinc finger protein 1 isoform X2 [Diabrotica virgifera virgifera]XP_028136039.1 GDNF-inducible zinc finger protein 1 isoform X2 [Diabrotica virgifera virgifera]XP_050513287.1 GDNF-inducible zinc finger protein 1 isoform X2 [Diabrotica virgifera virgifera]XP_050513288.1 GDNF-inducible zinc finger protein 1 isoform X2 [Diabrotica virgifera virgifera]
MYSLYQAWLTLGSCSSISETTPALPSTSPLNLSTSANLSPIPDVYLQVGPHLTQFSAHKIVLTTHSGFFKAAIVNQQGSAPIMVPNVNVEEFSSLLTFMYTGYLDVNVNNIYNIILATHILHMPRALDLCRSFLLQIQPPEIRTNIVKPIPSRKAVLPSQEIYAPVYSALNKSEDTPFKTVISKYESTEKTSAVKTDDVEVELEIQSSNSRNRIYIEKQKNKKSSQEVSNEKVVVDIACCDGPVKFHRVINKNYGVIVPEEAFTMSEVNQNEALNKVMNKNIRDHVDNETENQSNEVFTCIYCNHTFKSQYCYQKHARRHLNPISSVGMKVAQKETKREVKLLDMNVQYYPCKTCGSKFPSYYFVHKHRKLCHAEEMSDNNNKNTDAISEDIESTESNCSAIDVEAVNFEN